MSYPLGTGPQPPTPRPERRIMWTAAATVVLFAGLATAAAASGLRSDDPKESATSDTTDGTETTSSSTEGDDTTTSSIDLGATVGDLGLGSDEPPNDPLPGEGWNSEARTQFIEECADDSAWTTYSIDGNEVCTCIWQDLTNSGIATFDELNEEWQAEEADTSTPGGQALYQAVNACVIAAIPGLA